MGAWKAHACDRRIGPIRGAETRPISKGGSRIRCVHGAEAVDNRLVHGMGSAGPRTGMGAEGASLTADATLRTASGLVLPVPERAGRRAAEVETDRFYTGRGFS